MRVRALLGIAVAVALASCGGGPGTVKRHEVSVESKEVLFWQGHQLFLQQMFDSAAVLLERAAAMDPQYAAPLVDLGEINYLIGRREGGEKQPRTIDGFIKARDYLARAEALGSGQSEILERLCELSDMMEDDSAFVRYAQKNATAFPYDRQYFNLGLAYFKVGDYTNAIASQKKAIEEFGTSPYVGSFYRQLGRAYMKVDRDQTAERTFIAGLQKVDNRINELRRTGSDMRSSDEYHRLMEDKIGMLTSLRSLHMTYGARDKLEQVEQELKEANENK